MAASDARPIPRKNTAFRLYLEYRDNTGALIGAAATTPDTEVSIDGAAFADATNEFTGIGTTGCGYIDLTASEMNGDAIYIKSTAANANAKPFTVVLYPEELGDIRVDVQQFDSVSLNGGIGAIRGLGVIDKGTAQSATGTTLVLRAAAAFADDELVGATIVIVSATAGAGQRRIINDYVSATDTATVDTWTTTPTGTIVYEIYGSPPASSGLPAAANVTQWLGTAAATPTVGGVPEVDVTHWIGTAAATPTVAGVPEVDATHYLGSAAPALVGGRFDASVGAMAANTLTATAINADAITAAKVAADVGTEIAAAVGTRSIPDSYAADGAQPTIDQAILATLQCLTEAVVSGATILIKKPDGTTNAMTITCAPTVAAATSRTRSA